MKNNMMGMPCTSHNSVAVPREGEPLLECL